MMESSISAVQHVFDALNPDTTYPPTDSIVYNFEQRAPWWTWMYHSYEKNFDGTPLLSFSRRHYWLGPLFAGLYLCMMYALPRYMKNREPMKVPRLLKYWNLGLATFSWWGASRTVPYALGLIYNYGLDTALCSPSVWTYGRKASGLATGLFIYSKFFELFDTTLLIIRKKPVSFLHWYHHATVLMYTWDAYVTEQPPGMIYASMNYLVHSFMYTYYYLAATGRRPSWGMPVTIMQITQMVIGVSITIASLFKIYGPYKVPYMQFSTAESVIHPTECSVTSGNMISAAFMYSTYFYLFAEFFVKRYLAKKPSAKKTIESKNTEPGTGMDTTVGSKTETDTSRR